MRACFSLVLVPSPSLKMLLLLSLLPLLSTLVSAASPGFPKGKIYGVNLGMLYISII